MFESVLVGKMGKWIEGREIRARIICIGMHMIGIVWLIRIVLMNSVDGMIVLFVMSFDVFIERDIVTWRKNMFGKPGTIR